MLSYTTKLLRHLHESIVIQDKALVGETVRDLLDLKPEDCQQEQKAIVDALVKGFQFLLPLNDAKAVPADAPAGMLSLRQRLSLFRLRVVSHWPLEAQQYYFSHFHRLYIQKHWVHVRLGITPGDHGEEYASYYYQCWSEINTKLKSSMPPEFLLQQHLALGYLSLFPEVFAEEAQTLNLQGGKC